MNKKGILPLLALGILSCAISCKQDNPAETENSKHNDSTITMQPAAPVAKPKPFDSGDTTVNQGYHLFEYHCQVCHVLGHQEVGPDLIGIRTRWPREHKLIDFMVRPEWYEENDPYVKELHIRHLPSKMQTLPGKTPVTREEAKKILAYIDYQTKAGTQP